MLPDLILNEQPQIVPPQANPDLLTGPPAIPSRGNSSKKENISAFNQALLSAEPSLPVQAPVKKSTETSINGNKPLLDIHRYLPNQLDKPTSSLPFLANSYPGVSLANRSSDDNPLKSLPDGGFSFAGRLFNAHISPQGEVSFSSLNPLKFKAINSLDINTSSLEQIDAAKEKFLERPDVKNAILMARNQVWLEKTSEIDRKLQEIWGSKELSLTEKKRRIFKFWQVLPPSLSNRLFHFIRTNLPVGSPNAYSDVELASYGSKEFLPYKNKEK